MKKNCINKFFLFLSLIFLTSCVTNPKIKIKPPAPIAKKSQIVSLKNAQRSYKKKSFDMALKQINLFIEQNKKNELLLNAYLWKAKILKQKNRKKEACKVYLKSTRLPFFYKNQHIAFKEASFCLFSKGKIKEIFYLLDFIIKHPQESLSTKRQFANLQNHFIKKAHLNKKYLLKNLSHLIFLNASHKNIPLWKKEGFNQISLFSKDDLLTILKEKEDYGFFTGYLFFEMGKLIWKENKIENAKNFFSKSLSFYLDETTKKELKKYLKISQFHKKVNPYFIGVILPLSGETKRISEKILQGLQLGLGITEDSPYQLIVMNSKNHPDVTENAMEILIHNYDVIAIIGGLTKKTSKIIAEKGNLFRIPTIIFSQTNKITENKPFIFQNALSSDILMKHLSKYTKQELKLNRLSIFYPKDAYGIEYEKAFSENFQKYGGKIVSSYSYKKTEVDFKNDLKKLFRLDPKSLKDREEEYIKIRNKYLETHKVSKRNEKKLLKEQLLKPIINFEGIFIPDSLGKLEIILSYLKYFEIKDVYIIGSNLWRKIKEKKFSTDLPFIFIDTPALSKKELKKSNFYKKYINLFFSKPGFFERKAYDTGFIMKKALERKVRNRIDLQNTLLDLDIVKGSFYSIKISKNRVFSYPLIIYKFHKNEIISLDSVPVQ